MCSADLLVRHNPRLVEERIADVAIDTLPRIADECIPALAVILPRDMTVDQRVADRADRRRRDRERRRIDRSVAIVARVVVVQQVVVLRRAVHLRLVRQRREVLADRPDAWLIRVRTVAVAAARIAILRVPVVGAGPISKYLAS